MKINLLFYKDKKQSTDVVIGTLFVCFYNGGIKKLVSTKLKIIRPHFDKFVSEHNKFDRTTVIDYKLFNSTIENIIATKNPFREVNKNDGYISFIKAELSFLSSQNTFKTYGYIVNSFIDFLATKSLTEIPFDKLNFELFREYKQYLEQNGISDGTIRYYFIVHKSFLNRAIDENLTNIHLPLKKFKLKKNIKRTSVLTDTDIDLLRQVPNTHHLYKFIQFSFLQLFAQGLRYGDTLLIKFSDFKEDHLHVQFQKTKQLIKIAYSPLLIDTLYNILGLKFEMKLTSNPYTNAMLLDQHSEVISVPKKDKIIKFIREQPNQLLFDFTDTSLLTYDKTKPMTDIQYKAYILHRVNHNNHLGKLRKSLKLSVDTFTSHSMRYAYTRIALENDIPIHTISKSLGHSNVSITETYIRNGFGLDKFEDIGVIFSKKFKGVQQNNI
ncbi:MAG: phage integrase SAM-like domain-containing protein [Flavobacterium sp.]|nr:phage integrase SAM-like domain-containing protein [Flavobacterium sp.]